MFVDLQKTLGRAIAQAGTRWLYTAATQVQTWVYSCGICGGQSGTGFSPSTSISLASFYSTNFSIITITYHPGLVQ
jgi:hypothetical protein